MPWTKHLEKFKEEIEKRLKQEDTTSSCSMMKNQDGTHLFTTFDTQGVKQYIVFETPMRTLGYQRIK